MHRNIHLKAGKTGRFQHNQKRKNLNDLNN